MSDLLLLPGMRIDNNFQLMSDATENDPNGAADGGATAAADEADESVLNMTLCLRVSCVRQVLFWKGF